MGSNPTVVLGEDMIKAIGIIYAISLLLLACTEMTISGFLFLVGLFSSALLVEHIIYRFKK